MHRLATDDLVVKDVPQPPEGSTGASKDENKTDSQRKGSQVSVDEGYASSRDEADPDVGSIALECDKSIDDLRRALSQININSAGDVGTKCEDEEVVCRGPTKSKNEKHREGPYDQHHRRDCDRELNATLLNNVTYLDEYVCLEAPLPPPRPSSGRTGFRSDASQYRARSPSLGTPSPCTAFSPGAPSSVESAFSNGSSGSPLIAEFNLSHDLYSEAGRNGSWEESVSTVIGPSVPLFEDEVDILPAMLYPPTLPQNIPPSSPEKGLLHSAYQHATDNDVPSSVLGTSWQQDNESCTVDMISGSSDILYQAFQAACLQVDDDALLPGFKETFSSNMNFPNSSDAVTNMEGVDRQSPEKAETAASVESCAPRNSVNSLVQYLQDKGPLQPSLSESVLDELEDIFQADLEAKPELEVVIPVTIEELNTVPRKPVPILPKNANGLPADNRDAGLPCESQMGTARAKAYICGRDRAVQHGEVSWQSSQPHVSGDDPALHRAVALQETQKAAPLGETRHKHGGNTAASGGRVRKSSRSSSSEGSLLSLPEKDALHGSLSCDQLSKALVQVTLLKNKVHTRDAAGRTYLHNAVANGNTAVVYQLVEKFRKQPDMWIHIDTQDLDGNGPLSYCCMAGHAQLVGYLCEAGASVNLANKAGDTPLHLAAERGYKNIVVKLLMVPSINVNAKNKKGRSPLHAAVLTHKNQMICEQRPEDKRVIDTKDTIVKLLIAGGETSAQDICGETAVHYAVQQHKYDLLQVFMNYGNDVTQSLMKANKHGDTALHLACKMEGTRTAKQTQEDYVILLVNNGAPVNIANNKGQLPRDLVSSEVVLRWLSFPERM